MALFLALIMCLDVSITANAAVLNKPTEHIANVVYFVDFKDSNSNFMDGKVDKTAAFDYATLNTKLGLNNTETDVNGNPKVGIKTYKNGECYYIARIKHFNELTPWASGQAYGTDNATFLGRYGVLRNNWYELTVSKVSAPGYPDVPVVNPTDPDDEDTKFINVEVKILDWAKRTQQVEL